MRTFAVLTFVSALAASAQSDVLTRMDRSAKEFKSFSAKMARVDYTAILQESEEVHGIVRLKRTPQGLIGLMEFSEPGKPFSEAMPAEVVHLGGRTVERYFPKAANVEIYDVGKNGSSLDSIVLLGFGTEIAKLKQTYDIKPGASEKVGSVQTTKVELIPKTKDVKNLATRIELWIPEDKGYPIQEKITEPSKNYKLVTYSDVQMPAPADANFDLKVPPGTKEIHPSK
jgi:outer membrane lipoprotein-sorting protein